MRSKSSTISSNLLSASMLVLAGFSFNYSAQAAGMWDADTDDDWNTATNWDDDTVPNGIAVTISNGDGLGTPPPVISADPANGILSAIVGDNTGDGMLFIENGATLDVTGNMVLGANGSGHQGGVVVTGGMSTLDVGGITINGNGGLSQLTISDGARVFSTGGGAININEGGIVLFDGTAGQLAVVGMNGIVNNGALMFDQSSGDITIADPISGSGSIFVSSGGGTTRLTGLNSGFTGEFVVSSGTLEAGSNDAFGNDLGINSPTARVDGGTLDLGGYDAHFVSFSGSGGIVDLGSANLSVDQTGDTTYSGSIQGTGTLFKSGTGTLTLDGANTFVGGTTVSAGALIVNGSIGNVLVNNGGTLGGSGSLGNVAVTNGATIAPGNSVGIMYVATANFSSGSTYEVELNDGGFFAGTNNDLINASGAVTINGGTVHVTPENGTDDGTTYTLGTYTIITAGAGVAGTFDTVTDDYAFLDFELSYNSHSVFLDSSVSVGSFCLGGMSGNQCATGNGAYSLGLGDPLFMDVLNLSNAEAPGALDQLSGEIHASAKTALVEDGRFVRAAALDRLAAAEEGAVWVQGFGSWGEWDGNHNVAELSRDSKGLFLGRDIALSPTFRLGALAGYTQSDLDIDNRNSDGEIDSWHLGVYGSGHWDAWRVSVGGIWSGHDIDTTRSVAFTGFSDVLSANYDARTLQAFGEAGYLIENGSASFEPFARLTHVRLKTDSYRETGGAAALNAHSQDMDTSYAMLGVRAVTDVDMGATATRLNGSLGWRQAFGDTDAETTHAFAGSDQFTVDGVAIEKSALVIDLGASMDLTTSSTLSLSYNGQVSSDFTDHGLKIDFAAKF